ncbi:helix-turn-helix domain-containing protein [Aureispira sp. CCB-E]|uniref:helix-turn-helix domain-containing protein n=1 Tax=Aureispira sp. CCB-E TaxID=3051121 RepID=UPI0028685EF3|nr:helix-turn-helix domain-containing protein [Aureispira sp. CCB-E]WMX15910.1 helix-turn-helix domain-containing protein [Aureispira sp. CCB-E]
MSISERLKLYLFYSKKNVTQLADELGVTQSAFNRIVKGDGLPSSKVLTPLAEMGININWLLIGAGEMMQEGYQPNKDGNTIINNSKLTNSNNTNTGDNTVIQSENDSKLKELKAEIKSLKVEIKSLKKEIQIEQTANQLLRESKLILEESKSVLEGNIATLENQIKDKEMIISLLQGK